MSKKINKKTSKKTDKIIEVKLTDNGVFIKGDAVSTIDILVAGQQLLVGGYRELLKVGKDKNKAKKAMKELFNQILIDGEKK